MITDEKYQARQTELLVANNRTLERARKAEWDVRTLVAVIESLAEELGCEPDNEIMLQRIAAMKELIKLPGEIITEIIKERQHG